MHAAVHAILNRNISFNVFHPQNGREIKDAEWGHLKRFITMTTFIQRYRLTLNLTGYDPDGPA